MSKINFKTSNLHLLMLVALVFVSFLACETTKKVVTQEETTETTTLPSTPMLGTPPPSGAIVDKSGNALQVKYVRKNAHEDDVNMQILAEALDTMRKMNCADPISWYMQGAIHGAPYNSNEFCDTVSYLKALNPAWHNCTHDYDKLDLNWDEARLHFYSWHKLYLDHFEEAVRYITGKPEFTLPYWEYDNANYQTLPPLLVDKSSSLYESHRNAHMNSGGSIHVDTFPCIPDFTNPVKAFEAKSFELFTIHLENIPHNKIHVYLGQSPTNTQPDQIGGTDDSLGYMIRMYSPMDPVFWIHHANIDRLYEKRLIDEMGNELHNDGRPTKELFENRPWTYKFFKPGETELTEYDKDMGSTFDYAYGVQDYAYDMFIDDGSYNKTYEDKVALAISTNKWDTLKFAEIDVIAAHHDKDINVGINDILEFTLDLKPKTIGGFGVLDESWLLKIDAKLKEIPTKGGFTVYIRDEAAETDTDDCSLDKRAGVMTFFGLGHNHGNASSDNHQHGDGDYIAETHFKFDVTDEINFKKFSGKMYFKIMPTDEPDDAITIDKIQLIQRLITGPS